jgi:hypothetical protein
MARQHVRIARRTAHITGVRCADLPMATSVPDSALRTAAVWMFQGS